jgi:protein-disulfide isomerase
VDSFYNLRFFLVGSITIFALFSVEMVFATDPNYSKVKDAGLIAEANKGKTVDVIVLLKGYKAFAAKIDVQDKIQMARVQSQIAAKQQIVLNKLRAYDFTLRHRFENIPGFSGSIGRDGLEALAAMPEVEIIKKDDIVQTTRDDSFKPLEMPEVSGEGIQLPRGSNNQSQFSTAPRVPPNQDQAIKWTLKKKLTIKKSPLDVAMASNGKWLFVLAKKGTVYVYSADGTKHGIVRVGEHVDAIEAGPEERILFLIGQKSKSVETIELDLIPKNYIFESPMKGPADAPVVMVVYCDFQNESCANLTSILSQLQQEHSNSLKLVFKNFPLGSHSYATRAAVASMAAHQQGLFWQLHDLFFDHFDQLNESKIRELAGIAGLETEQFEKDLKDHRIHAMVFRDITDGVRAGVKGTPTIFINGKRLTDRSPQGVRAVVEDELSRTPR